jgi:hypothetical protein
VPALLRGEPEPLDCARPQASQFPLRPYNRSVVTNVVASTGTVMIGTLAIILTFQLLQQAVVLDVQNEPGRQQR